MTPNRFQIRKILNLLLRFDPLTDYFVDALLLMNAGMMDMVSDNVIIGLICCYCQIKTS